LAHRFSLLRQTQSGGQGPPYAPVRRSPDGEINIHLVEMALSSRHRHNPPLTVCQGGDFMIDTVHIPATLAGGRL